MQTQTPSPSTPSSEPSSNPSPGPTEQSLVLQLFLMAVANRKPIPPNLAVAVLALSPQYQELLAVKLAELEQADPEIVKAPQPALDALQKTKATRLANGQVLAQAITQASADQRLALYRKGLEAGLVQGPQGLTGQQADQLLPAQTQAEMQAQRQVLAKEDQAGKVVDLKQALATQGRL